MQKTAQWECSAQFYIFFTERVKEKMKQQNHQREKKVSERISFNLIQKTHRGIMSKTPVKQTEEQGMEEYITPKEVRVFVHVLHLSYEDSKAPECNTCKNNMEKN